MCGISGLLTNANGLKADQAQKVIESMAAQIAHRGPDSHGTWHDDKLQVYFGHRRLAIVDLAPTGHQPMPSASGRYTIVFNGEIYNFKELRSELQDRGYKFRGGSDTEVLLGGFDVWGIESTIKKSVGMFSIAVWDKVSENLTLIRDRAGEKPLYYGFAGNDFIFASEIKSLRAHPNFDAEINRDILSLYFRLNYIPAPASIFKNIKKLRPGHMLSISFAQISSKIWPESKPFWQLSEYANLPKVKISENDAIESLTKLIKQSVAMQMLADVPVGCFLSGGIDSSTIAAIMQSLTNTPIRTFSIGFENKEYNEAHFAKAVAQHIGSSHTELRVTANDAFEVIPKLAHTFDEPFSDSSQIPTYLLSKLAREHVTVSLSGDAGDELFGGYNRHLFAVNSWPKLSRIPLSTRKILSKALKPVPLGALNSIFSTIAPLLPMRHSLANPAIKLTKILDVLPMHTPLEAYELFISHSINPNQVLNRGSEPPDWLNDHLKDLAAGSDVENLMCLDFLTYLPDDILCKVDRASMASSLETRVPLLDHRIVEWAFQLPIDMKIRDQKGKWLLRQVLHQFVPEELFDRPKMGFAVPLGEWLRGPLKDWAFDLLSPHKLSQQGILNSQYVQDIMNTHMGGKMDHQFKLWDLLMFQSWAEKNLTQTQAAHDQSNL